MKKVSILLVLSLLTTNLFSQIQNPTIYKDDYLQKSKNQKTTGWVLLAGGTTIVVVGAVIMDNSNLFDSGSNFDTGGFLFLGGLVADLISIPFFISSGSNARKAVTISFNAQKIYLPQYNLYGKKTAFNYFKNSVMTLFNSIKNSSLISNV